MKSNGLLTLATLALAIGASCMPVAADERAKPSSLLFAEVGQRVGLLDGAVDTLDIPDHVGSGFALVVTIGGIDYALDLVPHSVRSADYQLLGWDGTGYVAHEPGPISTVRGSVVGDPAGRVAGGLVAGGILLQVVFGDGERFMIEPLEDGGPGRHIIYKNTDVVIDPGLLCGVEGVGGGVIDDPQSEGGVAGAPLQIAELAIDADFQWYVGFGLSIPVVESSANAYIGIVNLQWETEVGIRFQVTGIVTRVVPVYATNDAEQLLCQFSNLWADSNPIPNRDLAHLFTGKELNGGTVAGVATDQGQVCDPAACGPIPCDCGESLSGAYCLSWTFFDPAVACATDLISHEMGHLFNAEHCGCPQNTMNPGIVCANTFSAGSIAAITNYAASLPCIGPPCPGDGDCCSPNDTPGCDDEACCEQICAQDPVCCDFFWDNACAEAANQQCVGCLGVCPSQGNCFLEHDNAGCNDAACCAAVSPQMPFCCQVSWDQLCADEAVKLCSDPACPGDQPCDEPNSTPGCDDPLCCNIVCSEDPFCCDNQWDDLCASQAADLCGFAAPTGACCLPGGACVETTENECQGDYQGNFTLCADIECKPPLPCPDDGSCCEPNDTPGCDDVDCCKLICGQDAFCCNTQWDGVCADAAAKQCTVCGDLPCPGEGCCYVANGSPGCDDVGCCEAVCAVSPFCCDTEWDEGCASTAVGLCFAPACPGDTNRDFVVDVSDLTNVILDWSQAGCGTGTDVAPNGVIDVGDLTTVILNWGQCSG